MASQVELYREANSKGIQTADDLLRIANGLKR